MNIDGQLGPTSRWIRKQYHYPAAKNSFWSGGVSLESMATQL